MFRDVFTFAVKRTAAQALTFYIFWVVLTVIFAAVVSGFVASGATTSASASFDLGVHIGSAIAIAFSVLLSLLTLIAKKKTNSPVAWVMFVLAAVLSYLGGALLGMIPLAYLTTL